MCAAPRVLGLERVAPRVLGLEMVLLLFFITKSTQVHFLGAVQGAQVLFIFNTVLLQLFLRFFSLTVLQAVGGTHLFEMKRSAVFVHLAPAISGVMTLLATLETFGVFRGALGLVPGLHAAKAKVVPSRLRVVDDQTAIPKEVREREREREQGERGLMQ